MQYRITCKDGTEVGTVATREGALLVASFHSIKTKKEVHMYNALTDDRVIFKEGKPTCSTNSAILEETKGLQYLCTSIETRL